MFLFFLLPRIQSLLASLGGTVDGALHEGPAVRAFNNALMGVCLMEPVALGRIRRSVIEAVVLTRKHALEFSATGGGPVSRVAFGARSIMRSFTLCMFILPFAPRRMRRILYCSGLMSNCLKCLT